MKIQPGVTRRKSRAGKNATLPATKAAKEPSAPQEKAELSEASQNSPTPEPPGDEPPRSRGLMKKGLVVGGLAAVATLAVPGVAMAQETGAALAAGAVGEATATTAAETAKAAGTGLNIPGWVFPAVGGAVGLGMLYFAYKNFKLNEQRAGGGARGVSRRSGPLGSAKFDWVEQTDKGFKDVAGIKEAKAELMEMVQFLKEPEKFTKLGAKMPRGALLEGPPGTGKTLLAEAVAGEAGLPFVKVTGSEFVEKYVGVGASRVRELFAQARQRAEGVDGRGKDITNPDGTPKHKGAIIFIDEIDAIGQQRTGEANSAERESTLNQILTEMSGFKNDENILVIAATNRAELLDSALTRSGRFDRKVTVDAPGKKGRAQILAIHARNKPLHEEVNLDDIAARCPGLVGADMEAIMNEAAIYAARDGVEKIRTTHLSRAIDKVIMGEQRSGTILTQKERISTAYHEGGHAIIARALPSNGELHKVTILPRGKALGVTWTASEGDKHGYTKEELCDKICMLMGGRAAEELVFGEITTGASNDIERATSLANRIVNEFAMDEEVGLINLISPKKTGYQPSGELSNTASKKVKEILDHEYDRALEILEKNRGALNDISEGMLDWDELDKKEIDEILADRVSVERAELDLEQFRPDGKKGKGRLDKAP